MESADKNKPYIILFIILTKNRLNCLAVSDYDCVKMNHKFCIYLQNSIIKHCYGIEIAWSIDQ
jgi:hypothetical protein